MPAILAAHPAALCFKIMKSLTCFKIPVGELRKKIELVLSSSPPMYFVTQIVKKIELPTLEYNPEMHSFLIWEPLNSPETSVFAPNIQDGWHTLVNILSTKHLCDSYSIRLSLQDDEYPICELSTYEEGIRRRYIRVMKDDPKWEFFEVGEPYPFEELKNYSKRLKKHRFTKDMLYRYIVNGRLKLSHFGS